MTRLLNLDWSAKDFEAEARSRVSIVLVVVTPLSRLVVLSSRSLKMLDTGCMIADPLLNLKIKYLAEAQVKVRAQNLTITKVDECS